MAVTLEDIWESSSEELRVVLQTEGCDLSSNPQYDRTLVAMIYYNRGLLDEVEQVWVCHPDFTTAMISELTLVKGLHRLQSPYMTALLHLYELLRHIEHFLHETSVLHEVKQRHLGDINDWMNQFADNVGATSGSDLTRKGFDDFSYESRRDKTMPPTIPPLPILGFENLLLPTMSPRRHRERNLLELANIKLENLLPDGHDPEDPIIRESDRMTLADLPTDATLADIAQRWLKAIWSTLLNSDVIIRSKLQEVIQEVLTFPEPALDVKVMLTKFLDNNLDRANPIVRCIFLYSVWELIKASGAEGTLPELVAKFWLQVEAYGCLDAFKSEMDMRELTTHLIPALGPLLQSYLEPPPRVVMIARILTALNA